MDIQLLAVAAALVIVIIVFLGCFFSVGARERPFEPPLLLTAESRSNKSDKPKHKPATTSTHKSSQQSNKPKQKDEEREKERVEAEKEKEKERVQAAQQQQKPAQKDDGGRWWPEDGGVRKRQKKEATTSAVRDVEAPIIVAKSAGRALGVAAPIAEQKAQITETTTTTTTAKTPPPEQHPQDPQAVKRVKPKKQKQTAPMAESTGRSGAVSHIVESEPDIEEVTEQLKKAGVSESHLSIVVESLLLRQENAAKAGKSGDADEVKKLRRQLEEKERALAAESHLLNTANQRAREKQSALEGEKVKCQRLEATFREQLSLKQAEVLKLRHSLDAAAHSRQPPPPQPQPAADNRALIEEMQKNLAQAQAELQQAKADRGQHWQRAEQARQEADGIVERMRAEGERKAGAATDALARKDGELARSEHSLAKLRDDYAGLENAVGSLTDEFSRSQAALAEANQRLRQVEAVPQQQLMTNGDVGSSKELQMVRAELTEERARVAKTQAELQKKDEAAAQLDAATKKAATDIKEAAERVRQLEKEKKALDEQLVKEKEQRERLAKTTDGELAELRTRLTAAQSKEAQLVALQKEHESLRVAERALMDKVQEEVGKRGAAETEAAEAKAQLAAAKHASRPDAADSKALRNDLEEAMKEITNLREEIGCYQTSVSAKDKQYSNLDAEFKAKCEQLASAADMSGETAKVRAELEEQRQKNATFTRKSGGRLKELRERNYAAVEAVAATERNMQKLLDDQQRSHEAASAKERSETRSALLSVVPGLSSEAAGQTQREWLHELETVVRTVHTHSTTTAAAPPVDTRLAEENAQLKEQLAQDKQLLVQVDTNLTQLERSAARENDQWQTRCTELERQLAKVSADESNESAKSLKTANEARTQLTVLTERLSTEQQERDSLGKLLKETVTQLEAERATGRDLSAQAVKLRGMLKTGQDALLHEQQLVQQLTEQLRFTQRETAQSYAVEALAQGETGGQGLQGELDQMRTRLTDREEQLKKEMAINKLLNARLTSLGVTMD